MMKVFELINSKVFRAGFEQTKEVLDGKYKFAKELGSTIKSSSKHTASGKLFWNKDHS